MKWFSSKKKESAPPQVPAEVPVAVNAQLISQLKPYVAPPQLLPPNVAAGAPEILPGMVMAVAVDMGTQVNFMPESVMIELLPKGEPDRETRGPLLTRQQAIDNLRKLPLPPVQTFRVKDRADGEVFLLEQHDSFVAARVTFLNELIDKVSGGQPHPRGILVAIPRRRTLLLHILTGLGVLGALDAMGNTARGLFESSTESRLSPNVYYVAPDGSSEIVVFPDKEKGVIVQTVGKLRDVLYGSDGLLTKAVGQGG